MAVLITANTGSFPRIGEGKEKQRLRTAFSDVDSGKIGREQLLSIEREVTAEAISLQTKAGLDLITDGQISWNDPVSHVLGSIEGVEIGPLMRFFDTNFYYRQPIIKRKLSWQKPILLDEFVFAQGVSKRPVKGVITGPYTLARLSVDRAYNNFSLLLEAMCMMASREIAELAQAGATVIQIDEPAILQNPDDLGLLPEVILEMGRDKRNTELALYTYFGDSAPFYERLQQLPIDILGLDFSYGPHLTEVISSLGTSKTLGLGIINGRNTRLETEDSIYPLLDSLLSAHGAKRCYINPSCGLEYLPRTKAVAKLENMVRLRDKYVGGKHE